MIVVKHGVRKNVSDCVCRYFKSHTLLVEQRIEKDKLSEVVRESDAALRYLLLHTCLLLQ